MRTILSLFVVLLFVAGCGGGGGDTEVVTEPIEPEVVEPEMPGLEICHEPEEIIDFLDDASCSNYDPEDPFGESCTGERLVRMIQAPVLRMATENMRDRDKEIIREVVNLLNEGLPDEYDITIGPDLATSPGTRVAWLDSLVDVPSGEIHLSIGILQPPNGPVIAGEADMRRLEDEDGRVYVDGGIVRMGIEKREPSQEFPDLTPQQLYDCDRYIGQVISHEILHVLGFIGHVAEHWNQTATATTVDRIPAVTVMDFGVNWCANEEDPSNLNRFYYPLEYVGSMDKVALHALYGMDTWSYAEEFRPAGGRCE